MIAYAGLPALLVGLAVFAWAIRYVKLPKPLEALEALEAIGGYKAKKEDLKSLDKRLESLKIPLTAELFSAIKMLITILPFILGIFLVLDRRFLGLILIFSIPLIRKLPEMYLQFREKKRKEELLRDFPLMIDQVKIYAKAAGYYHALKIVSKSFKGSLGRELAILSAEMELMGLVESLNNFAARCGVTEISDFTRIMAVEETTGADISNILVNYSKMARQKQVSKIKRKIKIQPILMSILPAVLLLIFIMMFIIPLVTNIIQQINSIN